MRKLRIIGVMTVLCLVFFGCASMPISIEPPTVQDVVLASAKATGYKLAKENPSAAREIIEYTQPDVDNVVEHWFKWRAFVAARLVTDDYSRLLVEAMLDKVIIKINEDTAKEQLEGVRNVLRGFREGLEEGMKPK